MCSKHFLCFDGLLAAFTNSVPEKNIFYIYRFRVYIPYSLDLLNQSDKFSPTLENSKKLLLYDSFNAKNRKNVAHL